MKYINSFLASSMILSVLISCNKKYIITWKNYDGSVLKIDKEVNKGTIPSYDGETPTKPRTSQFSYSFNGWSPSITSVKCDATYTASYKEHTNTYKISFINDDGEILQEEMLEYGSVPIFKKEEPKSKKPKIGKKNKFSKWNKNIETVTEDKTYQAVYSDDIENKEMPIINISVDDGSDITSKTEYKHASISLNNTDKQYCFDCVGADIRGRGNTSWGMWPKKPYRIKFDKKRTLFGSIYKAKNWTLIANYSDKSLFRNYIAYELSKRINDISFSSIHIPIELYLNNEYLGVYLLCDQIQVNEGRVEIDEVIDPINGNNGYLIELDARAPEEGILNQDYFIASDNKNYTIKSPDTTSPEYMDAKNIEINYIKNYINQCYLAIENGTWNDVIELVDIDSFVSGYIIEELFMNTDCGHASIYYYKDKSGKLCHGPVWDFDIGGGNSNYGPGTKDSCPFDTKLYASEVNPLYKALNTRTEFKVLVKEKLNTFKSEFESVMNLLDIHNNEGLYMKNKESLERNFIKWDVMGKYIWPNPKDVYCIKTVDGQIDFFKRWLEGRYSFLLSEFSK